MKWFVVLLFALASVVEAKLPNRGWVCFAGDPAPIGPGVCMQIVSCRHILDGGSYVLIEIVPC